VDRFAPILVPVQTDLEKIIKDYNFEGYRARDKIIRDYNFEGYRARDNLKIRIELRKLNVYGTNLIII